MRFISAISAMLLTTSSFAVAMAAPGDLLFKLTAPQPQPGARFGETLATDGTDILVGEPSRLVGDVAFSGRVHLFDGTTGQLKYTLENPEPHSDDTFGRSIDLGDGYVFVGAPGLEQSVYVFEHATGALLREINPPLQPGTDNSHFGSGVAYDNGDLLIVDPSFTINFGPQNIGQGYLFDPSTGALQHIVLNPEPNNSDLFGIGISLAMFGDKMAIGSVADNSYAGRVWVIDRQTAEPVFMIENPRPDTSDPSFNFDFFAWSVAANEQVIVVGANEDASSGAEGSGTVYVFDSETGDILHTLFSPQLESNGEFGRSVGLTPSGDILVGAWGTTVDGIDGAGRVYLFDDVTGKLLLDIPNPEPSEIAQFGWSVESLGNRIVVGAMSANTTLDGEFLPATGAVYVFAIPEPPARWLAIAAAVMTLGYRSFQALRRKLEARSSIARSRRIPAFYVFNRPVTTSTEDSNVTFQPPVS